MAKKIEYYKELRPEFIRNWEKFTRERDANMDYGGMNSMLLFMKYLLKLLDDNGIKVSEEEKEG